MKIQTNLRLLHGPIDAAPLVNVLFLLMIFFLLGSSIVLQPGVEVKMHERIVGGGVPAGLEILTIARSGEIYFRNQKTDKASLKKALTEVSARSPHSSVILKSDNSVPNGDLISIMDIILESGLDVVLATQ